MVYSSVRPVCYALRMHAHAPRFPLPGPGMYLRSHNLCSLILKTVNSTSFHYQDTLSISSHLSTEQIQSTPSTAPIISWINMASYLPQHEGLLPLWLLFVSYHILPCVCFSYSSFAALAHPFTDVERQRYPLSRSSTPSNAS